MGYFEANEDGVRRSTRGRGTDWYYPLCCLCGEEVPSFGYQRGIQYTCKRCKAFLLLADSQRQVHASEEVKNKRLKNAISRIYAKTKSTSGYKKAIATVEKSLYRQGWFQSTEEVMVAIELLRNRIRTRHQVKFGRYIADFVLPDEKIVLEVDGVLFHPKSGVVRETARDNLIVLALGVDWEVIRITDEMINENITRLVPAIRLIRDSRKEVRAKHDGTLPRWYSDRDI